MQRHKTILLKDALKQVIADEGLETGLLHTKVYALWDELLGNAVARMTRKKYIKDNKLFVHLDSSVVRSQLFMMRTEIVAQINKKIGVRLIEDLCLL